MSLQAIGGNVGDIIKAATTATAAGAGAYGGIALMNPEQASRFIDMVIDTDAFYGETSKEKRIAIEGTISLLGVTSRNLRKKIEDTNAISGNEVKPVIKDVPYKTVGIAAGMEISNDFLRQNIERQGFEEHFIRKVAEQIGLDTLELALNGDESSSDPFTRINDGWLKILNDKIPAAQKLDGTDFNDGAFTDKYFYEMQKALPRKYFSQGNYKWICSHITRIKVMEFLRQRQTAAGDAALISGVQLNPLSIPFTTPTGFPDDVILLGNPKELFTVWTYNVGMKKTVEGKELVAKDNSFYAWFFDLDFVVRIPESFVMLTKVGEVEEL